MPRVADLGDCPLCFGKLLPLSVCQSCNSTVVRDGLEEVESRITCEDCGAENPTHFVCSACNARFPFGEIARPQGPTCPVCKSTVTPGAALCPNCSAVLPSAGGARPKRRLRGEYGEADVREVSRIPGVTREQASALCEGGYQTLWKIARATQAKLARVRGIGARAAANIKQNIATLQIISRPRTKEEVLSEEFVCPMCGTVTSLFSTRCHDCGAAFDEEELDEELAREVEREEDKGLLAYYDVRLLESPENSALLYARALLLLSMGRPTDALASLDKFLEMEPGNRRALQAKARTLASVKGVGGAAQVLRGFVAIAAPSAKPPAQEPAEEEALRALRTLEEQACPECGERQVPGAAECSACGHRFAPERPPAERPPAKPSVEEVPPSPQEDERIRLLEDLERAVAGETKAPPPPLRPVVPELVVDRKREMYTFLAGIPGVSRRAAEAVSAFFQDLEQIGLADVEDLGEIPGVAPAEARLIGEATRRRLAREEAPPPPPPRARPSPPPPVQVPAQAVAARPARAAVPTVRRSLEFATARRGLVNGKGLVNGRGRVNGLINGTGFVNGGSVGEPRLPRKNLMPRYIAVGASLMMLFAAVVALTPMSGPPSGIRVDGQVGDWSGIPVFTGIGTNATNPDLNIANASVFYQEPDGPLFVRVQARGNPAFGTSSDYRSLYVFVDADWDAGTGYEVGPIGADVMARMSGGGGIEETQLHEFEGGNDAGDWNAWRPSGPIVARSDGREVELAIPTVDIQDFNPTEFRVMFAFDDNAGSTSHTEVPIGRDTEALRVRQQAARDPVGIGPNERLFQVLLKALGGTSVQVQSMSIQTNLQWVLTPSPPWTANATGVLVNVSVDTSLLSPGSYVSASVDSVDTEVPFAIVGPEARAYVVQTPPPTQKRIDGLFADWPAPQPDNDTIPVDRPSLDITNRDGAVIGSDVFLYADFRGPALEGGLLPRRLSRPEPAGGPGGGGPPGPAPPPLIGQDYVHFYLDTNESEPGGFDAYGLLVNWRVEVHGRNGRVTDAFLYGWNGSAWLRQGTVNAAVGGEKIEVSATILGATFNMTRLVAVTADWTGTADVAQSVQTRGTRGNPGLLPLHGSGAALAYAYALTNGDASVDGDCATSGGEYAGADTLTDTGITGKVGRNGSYVFICVEVTGDSDDESTDEGFVYFDTDHSGGTSPQTDDRRFSVTSGSSSIVAKKGDGSGWVDCGSPDCDSGNAAAGAFQTDRQVYEYKIRFANVWGTDSPSANQQSGFAFRGVDTGGSTYTWGSTDPPSDSSPDTWGHLEIPEFPEIAAVLVAVVVPALAGYVRRRRR